MGVGGSGSGGIVFCNGSGGGLRKWVTLIYLVNDASDLDGVEVCR